MSFRQHTWSLGIEQFYTLWPLALLALLGRGFVLPACATDPASEFEAAGADRCCANVAPSLKQVTS
jgi:peptidoglycan/LPS O-acetylase OafA/YrhL